MLVWFGTDRVKHSNAVRRVSRGEALAIGAIGACLLVELALLRVGVDDLDEGYFAQQALRVLHGQVPFRDFETLYSPGLAYLHAALFALAGGPNVLALRALALLSRAALSAATYVMARPLVRNPLWAALPAIVLLVGLDDAPERWEPHPGWLSTLFAVLAAMVICRSLTTRALVLAGALCGVSYVFKQNTGVFMLLAIAFWTRQRSIYALAAFGGVTALWLGPLALAVTDVSKLGALVGAVNQAGLVAAPELTMLVPLACLVAAVRNGPHWYLVAGLALFATQIPRMDTLHLAWSAPILLALGAVALERARAPIVIAALIGLVALAIPVAAARLQFIAQPREAIANLEAPTRTAHDLADTIADVQSRTSPSDPIFVYPTSPLVYVLSDRGNPTRFDHVNPGAANPQQIANLIADLERAEPQAVVISDFWAAAWGPSQVNRALEDYLTSHFVDAARYGAYRVLVPR
jgi:hypothetical protein